MRKKLYSGLTVVCIAVTFVSTCFLMVNNANDALVASIGLVSAILAVVFVILIVK